MLKFIFIPFPSPVHIHTHHPHYFIGFFFKRKESCVLLKCWSKSIKDVGQVISQIKMFCFCCCLFVFAIKWKQQDKERNLSKDKLNHMHLELLMDRRKDWPPGLRDLRSLFSNLIPPNNDYWIHCWTLIYSHPLCVLQVVLHYSVKILLS